jgi:hypothetical protein
VCFSAEADLFGGAVLAVIGYDALRYVHHRSDRIAFAALPLLLAAHQLDEAFVWWGLQGHVSAGVGHVAMWIYLLFAFVVLPTYVPCAIRALEPPGRRRSALTAFAVMGAVVSAALLTAMLRGPVTATLGHDHVSYGIHLHAGLLVVGAYVVATCGSALFSGYRRIALFGALNLVGIAILARLAIDGFASLWCGWAALTSCAIALHLRSGTATKTVAEVVA